MQKTIQYKGELEEALYIALDSTHLRFPSRDHLKLHKNVKKKMHFTLKFMIHLTVQPRSAPQGTLDGVPKDALRMMGVYEGCTKGCT